MPAAAILRTRDDQAASELSVEKPIYDTQLYLPSSLPFITPCSSLLRRYEFRLREAQAYDALEELRQHLRLQTHMFKYKDKHVFGQRASTRQQGLINRVDKKVQVSAARYRTARTALSNLANHLGEFSWRSRLLRLEDEDIRRLHDGEFGVSEGRRTASWIWRVVGVGAGDEDEGMQEGA